VNEAGTRASAIETLVVFFGAAESNGCFTCRAVWLEEDI
jgi:hypothetical protein